MTGPHFGSRVIGETAFAELQKRARGGSAFGPRVKGTSEESDARSATSIDAGGAGLSVAQLKQALTDNPTFLDTLYIQELERQDGPRREALLALRATAVKEKSQGQMVKEIDELIANNVVQATPPRHQGGAAGAASRPLPRPGGSPSQKEAAIEEARINQEDPLFRGQSASIANAILDDLRRQTATIPRPGSAATGAEPSGTNSAMLGTNENIAQVGIIPGEKHEVMGTAGFVPGTEPEVVKDFGQAGEQQNNSGETATDADLTDGSRTSSTEAAVKDGKSEPAESTDLSEMTAAELRAEAERLGVEVPSRATKAEMTKAIKKAQKSAQE